MKNNTIPTKREILNAIMNYMNENQDIVIEGTVVDVTAADIVEYAEKTIAQLDTKAEKTKENQAKKRAEDPLKAAIVDVLTAEPQTLDQIMAQVGGEDTTKAKVVARLTALVKTGVADKAETKIEGRKSKVMTYFAADNGQDATDTVAPDCDVE